MHNTSSVAVRNTSIFATYTSALCLILDIRYGVDHVHILIFSHHFNLDIMIHETFQSILQFAQCRLKVQLLSIEVRIVK